MKELQKLVHDFEVNVLFNPDHEGLNVLSVFIDHKDKERRAVIIISEDTDSEPIVELAEAHFNKRLFKVIRREGYPEFKALLQTGKGIRHHRMQSWGTLGGIFNRRNDSALYGLSNAHVLANVPQVSAGDTCVYSPNINAGKLFRWYNLKLPPAINKMDAALFQINSGHSTRWQPVKPPPGWIGPRINLRVYKNGNATKITKGLVKSYNGSARVRLNGRVYYFSGIMAIKAEQGHFNQPGDSGSIVFSAQGNHMVGLVFAKYHEYCGALPISRIKQLLT